MTTDVVTHSCSTHRFYGLSCEDFGGLMARANGLCDRCGQPAKLNIDHDHALGQGAVRGVVCHLCNTRLGRVDSGEIAPDELDGDYLVKAWHIGRNVPFVADGTTKVRTVRVDDELWQAAQEKAKRKRETVAAVIKRALGRVRGGGMSSLSVYRAFDHGGALLYVGRTNNLPARLRAHRREKPWWSDVCRWTVDNFDTSEEAAIHERAAILGESPKHNVQHGGGRMVVVNFRVPEAVKEKAIERAEREGINLTDALRDFLTGWAAK